MTAHQVIVYAEAFGEGQEQSTLAPVVEGLSRHLDGMNETLTGKRITADAGYHSEANVELLYARGIDGYLADTGMRSRDPRFADADRHVDPRDLRKQQKQRDARFQLSDFNYDAERGYLLLPGRSSAGGSESGGTTGLRRCSLPGTQAAVWSVSESREVFTRSGAVEVPTGGVLQWQDRDGEVRTADAAEDRLTVEGRRLYGRRLGTVEPVFGHLRTHKRLDRFTLRSKPKVNGQWLLYCLVHNITKLMKVPEIALAT